MGTFIPPPGSISLAALSRVMGIKLGNLYSAVEKGRGPELHTDGRYKYTTFDAAIEWLRTYRGRRDYQPAIRALRARQSVYQAFNEPRRAA